MKKILALIFALMLTVACFVGCDKGAATGSDITDPPASGTDATSDFDYIKTKGKLTVGITDFAPMDYQDKDGNWVGFDADLAKKFAEYLGVTVEFQLINWDNKAFELSGKTIDVVWNGMTLNDEVKSAMSCSKAYLNNAQIVILPKDKAASYPDIASMKSLNFAVEQGSAGKDMAVANGFKYTEVADQATALLEVKTGNADAAVIDSLMAAAMVGEGTNYENLVYTLVLNSEEYGIGFRKNSDLVAKINDFLKKSYDDGTITALAETYGVSAAVIAQ